MKSSEEVKEEGKREMTESKKEEESVSMNNLINRKFKKHSTDILNLLI